MTTQDDPALWRQPWHPYDLALWHQPRHPFAYPLAHERLRVRLRLAHGDERRPSVAWSDTQNWSGPDDRIAMRWVADDGMYAYWEADVTPYEGRTRYIFHLEDAQQPSASRWFGERGVTTIRPESGWPDGYFHWPYLHRERFVSTPAWLRDAIGYEIFPDRFARGTPPVAPQMANRWPGRPTSDAFWGGDLIGVIDSLDYIAGLGVNLIWFTPIFQSPSNHKYNIDDYERIDPTFGDDAIFQRLIAESRARGMRVVLDGVFNHSGINFAPWRDVTQRGIASPYWGWFDVRGELPDPHTRNYRTFGHTASMPRLMTANPEVQAYLIERAQRWTRMGVSGWRLDVADEVDPSFWRAFRREIRAVNPDAYLVGEIAYDASRWLEGDQFDGVMNYPLRHALLQFAAAPGIEAPGAPHANQRLDGRGFLDAVSRVRSWYPGWATTAALNPLSTHDVPRFLTAVGGDVARLRLGLAFLLTYEGIPLLYYGDEVGLEGGHDPDTRRPMLWEPERQDRALLADVRALTRLRHESAALRGSGFRPIATADRRVAVYLRGVSGTEELPGEGGAPGDVALVALNASPESITLDLSLADLIQPALAGALTWPANATHARNLLTNERIAVVGDTLRVSVPPVGAAIFEPDV